MPGRVNSSRATLKPNRTDRVLSRRFGDLIHSGSLPAPTSFALSLRLTRLGAYAQAFSSPPLEGAPVNLLELFAPGGPQNTEYSRLGRLTPTFGHLGPLLPILPLRLSRPK